MDEYAHQVDFFVLDPSRRAVLQQRLGASAWCYEVSGLAHGANGCERFTSMVAWAYWPSKDNSYRPRLGLGRVRRHACGRVQDAALARGRHADPRVGPDPALSDQRLPQSSGNRLVRVSASSLAMALRT